MAEFDNLSDAQLESIVTGDSVANIVNRDFKETILDAVSGFAQGATANFGDEIFAATQAAGKYIGSGGNIDFTDTFQRVKLEEFNRLQRVANRSPVANTVGELAAVVPFFGKLAVTKAPTLIPSIQEQLGLALYGAVTGVGESDIGLKGSTLDDAKNRAVMNSGIMMASSLVPGFVPKGVGLFGGMTSRVLDKLTKFSPIINKPLNAVNNLIKEAPVSTGLIGLGAGVATGNPGLALTGAGASGFGLLRNSVNKFPIGTRVGIEALGSQVSVPDAMPITGEFDNLSDQEMQNIIDGFDGMSDEELQAIANGQ